jgi:hypothetical protein
MPTEPIRKCVVFDHLRLVKNDRHEVRKLRHYLGSMKVGEVAEATTEHEADNRCCTLEPWDVTWARLTAGVELELPHFVFNFDWTPGLSAYRANHAHEGN